MSTTMSVKCLQRKVAASERAFYQIADLYSVAWNFIGIYFGPNASFPFIFCAYSLSEQKKFGFPNR